MNPYSSENPRSVTTYQNDTSFQITFHNGYIIRNLFDFVKKCHLNTNIRLSKNSIYFSEGNDTGTILCEFYIDTSELIDYKFVSSYDVYLLSFDTTKFMNLLKSVGTTETLRIYKQHNQDLICFQIVKSHKSNPGSGSMLKPLILNGKIINHIPPEFSIDEKNPTCKATITEFWDDCKKMNDQQYENVIVKGTDRGISFFANDKGLSGGNLAKYGIVDKKSKQFDISSLNLSEINLSNIETNTIITVQQKKEGVSINIGLIKSFMTLKNIAGKGNSIIKFFYETLPYPMRDGTSLHADTLKMIIPIGTCGKMKVYIR